MKCITIRVNVPSATLPTAPVVVRLVSPGAVIKKVSALQVTTATATDQMGFKLTNDGQALFPFQGIGINANENNYAPVGYGGTVDFNIFETLSGPPYNIEASFFNRTGGAVVVDLMIYTDGKERSRRIEEIKPDDIEKNKVVG